MAARLQFSYEPKNSSGASGPQLAVQLGVLENSSGPNLRRRELTTYSTELTTATPISPSSSHQSDPSLDKYTVQEPYSRTLSADPMAAKMDLKSNCNAPYDLTQGYGTEIKKNLDNEFMSLLLECLARDNLIGQSEFICFRNLLSVIGLSPYEAGSRFDLGAIVVVQKIGKVFYMFGFPTKDATEREEDLDAKQKQMIYWGLNFESYVTVQPGQGPSTSNQALDLNKEYCSVVEMKIGSHSVIFRAEMDSCRPSHAGSYVELKTSKDFDNDGHKWSFRRYKLIKWWLQSYLADVKQILCGFRDDSGIVRRLEWYNVTEIPQIMQEDRQHCKPKVCLGFIESFLDFVKTSVKTEFVPHVFKRDGKSKTFEMTLDREGKYKFIPNWFVAQARN